MQRWIKVSDPDVYGGLSYASLANETLRLDYLTTTGPRIVGLYLNGVKGNLLASTPEVHWETPHGQYYLRGGHRLWTAPEDPFYTCPEEGLDVSMQEDGGVTLRSPIDASGLQKEITVRLDEGLVVLSHRITWHGIRPIEFAPWTITQLRLGGMAILPLSNQHGLAPNRNIVLWPYSDVNDARFELHNNAILLHGTAGQNAFKAGYKNSHGWIAYALGDVLFVKQFDLNAGNYADMNCNVEAYVKDVCLELEALGRLTLLPVGGSVSFEETWLVFAGEYPASWTGVQKVLDQLSQL
jgi:hypothetical protein